MGSRWAVMAATTVTLLLASAVAQPALGQEIPQPLLGNCCFCKGQIRIVPGLDFLRVGARIVPTSTAIIDPVTTGMSVEISNANGTVISVDIPPGAFVEKPNGRRFVVRDRTAKQGGGVYIAMLQERPGNNPSYLLDFRYYGDLSAATLADMTTVVTIGSSPFFDVGPWSTTRKGWVRKFP